LSRVLEPTDTTALYHRGHRRALGGDVGGARGDLRRAFDRDASSHEVALELAWLENTRKDARAALEVIHRFLERVPEAASDEDVTQARFQAESRLVEAASSIEDLETLVSSPLPETRRRVVYALARLESPDVIGVLRRLLDDPNAAVRGTALKVYMRPWLRTEVQRDEALGTTVAHLLANDPSDVVRGAAAGLLGLIPAPYAVGALVEAMVGDGLDAAPYPRSEAARALGRQGGARASSALVQGLLDPDPDVRTVVVETLYKIAGTYHGYDPRGDEGERAKAVERWRQWLGTVDAAPPGPPDDDGR
jgi:HEAT repeat protein